MSKFHAFINEVANNNGQSCVKVKTYCQWNGLGTCTQPDHVAGSKRRHSMKEDKGNSIRHSGRLVLGRRNHDALPPVVPPHLSYTDHRSLYAYHEYIMDQNTICIETTPSRLVYNTGSAMAVQIIDLIPQWLLVC